VKLNGHALGVGVPDKPLSAEPSTAWLEWQPGAELVQEGANLIEIQLNAGTTAETPSAVEALYLTVQYQ